jgi:hypothetical protein
LEFCPAAYAQNRLHALMALRATVHGNLP